MLIWQTKFSLLKNYMRNERYAPIIYTLSFILAGICVIAYAFLKYDVDSDIAKSYSYLAQEFSHGNWEHFCNPNLPLLMPFISGILTWALHIAPWRSCMLVSGIFYVCTLFPLHKLLRHFMKSNLLASLGCLLYVVAPQLLRFSCSGWLETGRTFFVVSSIYLIIKYAGRFKTSTLVLLGTALGCLCLVRGEGIFFALLLGIYCIYLTFVRRKSDKFVKAFRAGSIIFVITILFLLPRAFISYYRSGYFVPDQRIVPIINKISGNTLYLDANSHLTHDYFQFSTAVVIKDFIDGTELGYLILAILGIAFLLWEKRWRNEYHILLLLPVLNFFGCLHTVSTHRYFTLNVPLFMIFILWGIIFAYRILGKIFSRKYAKYLLFVMLFTVVTLELAKGLSYIARGSKISHEIGNYIADHKYRIFQTTHRPLIYSGAFTITTYSDLKIVNRYLVKIPNLRISNEFDGAVFRNAQKGNISQAEIIICSRTDFEKINTPYDKYITIYRKKTHGSK